MSGTSCDSIDVGLCLVKPDLSCTLLDGLNYKYPNEIREHIFKIFHEGAKVEDICKMNFVMIIGVNLGGLGTLIASMASLIS